MLQDDAGVMRTLGQRKGTILVQISMRPEYADVIEGMQVITGEGIGQLLEEAMDFAIRLQWRRLIEAAAARYDSVPPGFDWSVFDVALTRAQRRALRRKKR